jgi:ketosteroid isomerase-like protein
MALAEEIRAAIGALAASFDAPDPAAWVDEYTEDAMFIGPRSAAIEGREALRALVPHLSMSDVEIVAESVIGSGDLAAATGRASWNSGDGERVRRRFLMVWRRDGGRWRLAREMLVDDV